MIRFTFIFHVTFPALCLGNVNNIRKLCDTQQARQAQQRPEEEEKQQKWNPMHRKFQKLSLCSVLFRVRWILFFDIVIVVHYNTECVLYTNSVCYTARGVKKITQSAKCSKKRRKCENCVVDILSDRNWNICKRPFFRLSLFCWSQKPNGSIIFIFALPPPQTHIVQKIFSSFVLSFSIPMALWQCPNEEKATFFYGKNRKIIIDVADYSNILCFFCTSFLRFYSWYPVHPIIRYAVVILFYSIYFFFFSFCNELMDISCYYLNKCQLCPTVSLFPLFSFFFLLLIFVCPLSVSRSDAVVVWPLFDCYCLSIFDGIYI